MRLDLRAIPNSNFLLNFREGSDKTIVTNLTAIKVDRFDHPDIFPENNIVLNYTFVEIGWLVGIVF